MPLRKYPDHSRDLALKMCDSMNHMAPFGSFYAVKDEEKDTWFFLGRVYEHRQEVSDIAFCLLPGRC